MRALGHIDGMETVFGSLKAETLGFGLGGGARGGKLDFSLEYLGVPISPLFLFTVASTI